MLTQRIHTKPLALLVRLLASLGVSFGSLAFADDARVRIVSPIEGQQFAPGDKVSVVVVVAPSLHATDGSVGLEGLGLAKGIGFPGTRFTANFVIPDYYAGLLTLWPDVWAGQTVLGSKVRIKVRPPTPPKQIRVLNRYSYVSRPRAYPDSLYVKGLYAGGLERDLSSSASGTAYASSNPSVVAVDSEGKSTVIADGIAVITIANGGVRDFAVYVVDDPAHPSPAIDLTNQVAIQRGSLRLETNPKVVRSHYQQVTITNASKLPLAGPLFLAVTELPKGVITYGGDGRGRYRLDLPDEGLGLLPKQSVRIDLEFLNQGSESIAYIAKVFHGIPR